MRLKTAYIEACVGVWWRICVHRSIKILRKMGRSGAQLG
jgi:hypothetical protein